MGWLNTLLAALVFVNYAAGTFLVWDAFRSYPDHSPMAVFRWIAIYAMAVIHPVVWSYYHVRLLKARGLEIDRQMRRVVFSPMVVGGITLLIALNLIDAR